MEDEARERGVFDAETLEAFASRLAANNYVRLQDITLDDGVRVHVPLGSDQRASLAAFFPSASDRERAQARDIELRRQPIDEPGTSGEQAVWMTLKDFACVSSKVVPEAVCASP